MGNTGWGCVDPQEGDEMRLRLTREYQQQSEEHKLKLQTLSDENEKLKQELEDQNIAIQEQQKLIASKSDGNSKIQKMSMENIKLKQQLTKQKSAIQRQLESQKNQMSQFKLSKQESREMSVENQTLKKQLAAQELTINKMQQELEAIEQKDEEEEEEEEPAEDSQDSKESKEQDTKENKQDTTLHEQPFADAKPSIIAFENFTDSQANKAANILTNALANKGDRNDIITVTVSYSQAQRMQIVAAYNAKTDKKNKACNLVKDFKKILSGNFKKVVVGLWSPPGLYDAIQVDAGVEGIGFKTELLNEIICTRTAAQLDSMRSAWYKGIPLLDRIRKDTSKGKVGNYAKLLCALLEGKRPANGVVDVRSAQADANVLNSLLKGKKDSNTKAKFVEIFTTRSWTQIREISHIFPDVSLKYTLNHAIKDKFGSGDTGKALMMIESFACKPYDFFADLLIISMRGAGTDNDLLRRVIISRADVDLQNVTHMFNRSHGDGLTLNQWFEDESAVSGDYKKLLLAICGFGLPQKK